MGLNNHCSGAENVEPVIVNGTIDSKESTNNWTVLAMSLLNHLWSIQPMPPPPAEDLKLEIQVDLPVRLVGQQDEEKDNSPTCEVEVAGSVPGGTNCERTWNGSSSKNISLKTLQGKVYLFPFPFS